LLTIASAPTKFTVTPSKTKYSGANVITITANHPMGNEDITAISIGNGVNNALITNQTRTSITIVTSPVIYQLNEPCDIVVESPVFGKTVIPQALTFYPCTPE